MECFYGRIWFVETGMTRLYKPILHRSAEHKTRLMLSRTTLNRVIIIAFMVLIGFSLAKAIYHKSFMGITLALVSLGAAIYFLYILVKAQQEMEMEAEEAS